MHFVSQERFGSLGSGSSDMSITVLNVSQTGGTVTAGSVLVLKFPSWFSEDYEEQKYFN